MSTDHTWHCVFKEVINAACVLQYLKKDVHDVMRMKVSNEYLLLQDPVHTVMKGPNKVIILPYDLTR